MDHGRILALDTPAGLKRSLGADTVIRVTAEGDLAALSSRLREGVDGVTEATVTDGGVHLQLRDGAGALPRVVTAADAGGFKVTDLSITEPTLETVFISLTGKDLRE
jgi:ABC-2 type transport system ATP-binding protein